MTNIEAARDRTFSAIEWFWCALRNAHREFEMRQAMSVLGGFEDHSLNDIGVQRGSIESAVRHGRSNMGN